MGGPNRTCLPDHVIIKEKKKSAWEMNPDELQKGYQQMESMPEQDPMAYEQQPQDEFGQPMEQGYDQGAVPAATPMEPAAAEVQQGYGQPQAAYGQPEMVGQTPGGDFNQYQ